VTIGHTPNAGMTVIPLELTPYNGVMFTIHRSLHTWVKITSFCTVKV